MNQVRYVSLATLLLIWNCTWAGVTAPEVTGSSMRGSPVTAHTINVHRGEGSYMKSLPGSATSWNAATLDGTSWFSSKFSVDSTSQVSVSAIYPDGRISNQRTMVAMTPGDQPNNSSIINHNNYLDILKDAFSLFLIDDEKYLYRNKCLA